MSETTSLVSGSHGSRFAAKVLQACTRCQLAQRIKTGLERVIPHLFIFEFRKDQRADRILLGIGQFTGTAEGFVKKLRHASSIATCVAFGRRDG